MEGTVLINLALVLGLAVAAILAYASTKPGTFSIQRSITIKARPERIFPLINDLHQFQTWSPYVKRDLAMKQVYSGPVSGKGAAYAWDGNKNAGKGCIEIVDTQPPGRVALRLDMEKPMAAQNAVVFTLVSQGDMTIVTWAMSGDQPLMGKVAGLFMDIDGMVGRDFEEGLSNLKALVEA